MDSSTPRWRGEDGGQLGIGWRGRYSDETVVDLSSYVASSIRRKFGLIDKHTQRHSRINKIQFRANLKVVGHEMACYINGSLSIVRSIMYMLLNLQFF